MPQEPEPQARDSRTAGVSAGVPVQPLRMPLPTPLRTTVFAFLGDRAFIAALALALPAWLAFTLAPWFGVAVRVPSSAWTFLLLYPLLEELAFRGLLQGQLLRVPGLARPRIAAVSLANVLTATAFAAAHLLREPWPWAVATFFPGLVFGWARERTDGVAAPVVLHVAYNFSVWLAVWIPVWFAAGLSGWLPEWVTASTTLALAHLPFPAGGGG